MAGEATRPIAGEDSYRDGEVEGEEESDSAGHAEENPLVPVGRVNLVCEQGGGERGQAYGRSWLGPMDGMASVSRRRQVRANDLVSGVSWAQRMTSSAPRPRTA